MKISTLFTSRFTLLVVSGIFLAIPCARATTTLLAADQTFLLAAAQGGLTEVKLGELAFQNGQRAEVKEFGQLMVKDHSAINADLKTLATQKEVTLLAGLDAKHQEMVDKLSALNGPAFDKAYIAAMIEDHKMDAKDFQAESSATTDTDVKNFVEKSLPVVLMHLEHISAMKQ